MAEPVRPILVVEGDGDRAAVPELLRRIAEHLQTFDMQPAPRPIKCGDVRKIGRPGMLERFVEYACRRDDGDSVLLVVDCDDDCPAKLGPELAARAQPIAKRCSKKVGIVLLYREFESLFLMSFASIRETFADYRWHADTPEALSRRNLEELRGAKELLRNALRVGTYKETRDQVRFVTALDFDRLYRDSRAFRHLLNTLEWLREGTSSHWAYPSPPRSRQRR